EETALCKACVRISEVNVEGNGRKKDGFYLDNLDHMYTDCPITRRRTYDMINEKWKNAGDSEEEEEEVQEVQRPMGRDRVKKKGTASMASSTSGNEDLLDRLMVNEFVDLTQTHKVKKSKNVEAFIEIKRGR
nr:hypothetical protein [Tanacetum cinerariifolium]